MKSSFPLAQPPRAATSRQQLKPLLLRSAQTRATKVLSSTTFRVQDTKPPPRRSAATLQPPQLRSLRTALAVPWRSSRLRAPPLSLATSEQAPRHQLPRYLHKVPTLARSSIMFHQLQLSIPQSPAVAKLTPLLSQVETDHHQALWKL